MATKQTKWLDKGAIASAQATLTTGVTLADFRKLVDLGKALLIELNDDWDELELRFRTNADNDAQVAEIWSASLDANATNDPNVAYFDRIGVATLTGGPCAAPESTVFVDTAVVSNDEAPGAGIVSRGHLMERLGMDIVGRAWLAIIATTLAANTNLHVDVRGL